MQVIAFVGQKGGTGKSTLALNLAVTAMAAGERVAIIDLDPQRTAGTWREARSYPVPEVVGPDRAGSLPDTLAELDAKGMTFVLIDTASGHSPAGRAAAAHADLCLVPIRPCEADVRATMPTLRMLGIVGVPYLLVVNQAPARVTSRLVPSVDDPGPVLPLALGSRIDHQYAYALGMGVAEYAPAGKAAREVAELWRQAKVRLRACTGQHRPGREGSGATRQTWAA
jgi:chromosome partitioning protein